MSKDYLQIIDKLGKMKNVEKRWTNRNTLNNDRDKTKLKAVPVT